MADVPPPFCADAVNSSCEQQLKLEYEQQLQQQQQRQCQQHAYSQSQRVPTTPPATRRSFHHHPSSNPAAAQPQHTRTRSLARFPRPFRLADKPRPYAHARTPSPPRKRRDDSSDEDEADENTDCGGSHATSDTHPDVEDDCDIDVEVEEEEQVRHDAASSSIAKPLLHQHGTSQSYRQLPSRTSATARPTHASTPDLKRAAKKKLQLQDLRAREQDEEQGDRERPLRQQSPDRPLELAQSQWQSTIAAAPRTPATPALSTSSVSSGGSPPPRRPLFAAGGGAGEEGNATSSISNSHDSGSEPQQQQQQQQQPANNSSTTARVFNNQTLDDSFPLSPARLLSPRQQQQYHHSPSTFGSHQPPPPPPRPDSPRLRPCDAAAAAQARLNQLAVWSAAAECERGDGEVDADVDVGMLDGGDCVMDDLDDLNVAGALHVDDEQCVSLPGTPKAPGMAATFSGFPSTHHHHQEHAQQGDPNASLPAMMVDSASSSSVALPRDAADHQQQLYHNSQYYNSQSQRQLFGGDRARTARDRRQWHHRSSYSPAASPTHSFSPASASSSFYVRQRRRSMFIHAPASPGASAAPASPGGATAIGAGRRGSLYAMGRRASRRAMSFHRYARSASGVLGAGGGASSSKKGGNNNGNSINSGHDAQTALAGSKRNSSIARGSDAAATGSRAPGKAVRVAQVREVDVDEFDDLDDGLLATRVTETMV